MSATSSGFSVAAVRFPNRSGLACSNGDDAVWRRHLGFVLDGLRAR
ncbi:MAG TPA: hypothetical protein VN888_28110 [Mycobacterium sp.]|nr:hypothetical protein [Mycobacterium sp.]